MEIVTGMVETAVFSALYIHTLTKNKAGVLMRSYRAIFFTLCLCLPPFSFSLTLYLAPSLSPPRKMNHLTIHEQSRRKVCGRHQPSFLWYPSFSSRFLSASIFRSSVLLRHYPTYTVMHNSINHRLLNCFSRVRVHSLRIFVLSFILVRLRKAQQMHST